MSASDMRGKKKESRGDGEAPQTARGELHQTAGGQHCPLTIAEFRLRYELIA